MSECKHEFLEIENNDIFLQCTKCGVWIETNEYPLHEAEQRIIDLEAQLAEAREENKILQHHMQCIARTKPNLVNPIKPYDLVERAINALHQAEQLKERGE